MYKIINGEGVPKVCQKDLRDYPLFFTERTIFMLKTFFQYDQLDDKTTVSITPMDEKSTDAYCYIFEEPSFAIENPLATYPKKYIENINNPREKIELEHAMAAAYDYCWRKDDKPLLHADPIKLLENAINNLIVLSKENDLLHDFAITEPYFLTPIFDLSENNELEFSTYTDNKGRKAISLTKYNFDIAIDCNSDFIKNNKEFMDILTNGKKIINYCDLLKHCIELLWKYYQYDK